MAPTRTWLLCGLAAVFFGPACIEINQNVATPTALERQLLGAYEELDRDLVLASSVRAPVAAPASFEAIEANAVSARALQRFNEDDLLELKARQCIAERMDGSVVERSCQAQKDEDAGATKRRLKRVVEEENQSRGEILRWAAYKLAREEGRRAPSPEEVAEIRRTYYRLLRESAQKGQVFEVEKGVFRETQ